MLQWIGGLVGGAFKKEPEGVKEGDLSDGARKLIDDALRAFVPSSSSSSSSSSSTSKEGDGSEGSEGDGEPLVGLVDYHTHLIGTGSSGSGCCVSQSYLKSWNPIKRLKGTAYMTAGGVSDVGSADEQYLDRLVRCIRGFPVISRHAVLAFDKHHNDDGEPDDELTEFYTPNDYVWDLCQKYPDVLLPTMSVHPYRKDALEELERCAKRGVRMIKWLPNAMNINPMDERCEAYYDKMVELDLVLLSHAGEEKAVEAEHFQRLGNPLLMRAALKRGAKVILAHCASLGSNPDLDDPSAPMVSNFELFLRLMDEGYEGQLFADISAITIFTRIGCIPKLLERTDLHHRLINGSDYPLPAFNILIRTQPLVKLKLLTPEERNHLNEIYHFNPLLYDFVLKRTLKGPKGERFADCVFAANRKLGLFLDVDASASASTSTASSGESTKRVDAGDEEVDEEEEPEEGDKGKGKDERT